MNLALGEGTKYQSNQAQPSRAYFTQKTNQLLYFDVKQLIGWKDGSSNLLVEPTEYDCLHKVRQLNVDAASIHELYPGGVTVCGSGSIWNDMVLSPSRVSVQSELKATIQAIESRAS